MRKVTMLLVGFLLLAVPAFAQDYAPFEVFAGYNFVRLGDEIGSSHGWNAAFTGNLNSVFGIKGEVAGTYKSETGRLEVEGLTFNDAKAKISILSFMAGPQVTGRIDAFPGTLFGHALFGFGRFKEELETGNATVPGYGTVSASADASTNAFAMALGGGLDWGKGRIGIRAPQVDYFPLRSDGSTLNNFRISAGVVFRFGN